MRRGPLFGLPLGLLLALGAATPAAASDATEKQYLAARDLERAGQNGQARSEYQALVDAEPRGVRADDALLALARLELRSPGPDGYVFGAASPDALDTARGYLERIRKDLRESDCAPEALYWLALLNVDPQARYYSPDESLGILALFPRYFPAAAQLPQALALAARLYADAGKDDVAQQMAFRAVSGWPSGGAAAAAWLVLAEVEIRAGRLGEALACCGRAQRAAGEAKDAAARARNAAALLERLAFAHDREPRPAFALDEHTGPELRGKPLDLAAAADGTLYAVTKDDQYFVLRGNGVPEPRPLPGMRAATIDPWGRLWAAGEQGLYVPEARGLIALPPKMDVLSIASAGPRAVWIVDDRDERVVKIDDEGKLTVTAALPARCSPRRVVAAAGGGAVVLDGGNLQLVEIAADGRVRSTTPLAGAAERPTDLERDALGFLYVLDTKAVQVAVFGPHAARLATWKATPQEAEKTIGKPAVLVADPAGNVALWDARSGRLAWLR